MLSFVKRSPIHTVGILCYNDVRVVNALLSFLRETWVYSLFLITEVNASASFKTLATFIGTSPA